MKVYCVVFALAAVVSADFYNPKYDNFDVQPLVENDRILQSFTNCFLDQGPCSPDAKDFKKVIPEALATTCGKCSPKQQQLIRTVILAMRERHPDAWEQLTQKFDREEKYKQSFDQFLYQQY